MNPFIPCPFTYGDIPGGGAVAIIQVAGRDPNAQDKLAAGTIWLSALDQGGTGTTFIQEGFVAGIPTWITLSAGVAGALNTLSDGSTSVLPSAGNIAIVGTANQLTVTSNAGLNRLELSLPANVIIPGTMTVTGLLTMLGGFSSASGTFTSSLTADGTILLNTVGNGNTTIGNIAGTGFIHIDVGSGNFALAGGAHTVGIANDAAANLVTLGSTTAGATTTVQGGTSLLLTGATTATMTIGNATQTGLLTLGLSTAGQNINIGSAANTAAQTITIGNGASANTSVVNILSGTGTAGTATLALGNNPRLTIAGLADVVPVASRNVTVGGGTIITAITDTIDIGPDGATTNAGATKTVNVNTGGVTLGSVLTNIATGAVTSGTHTTAIATGNRAAGTMALNIFTGTGTKTMTVGGSDAASTLVFRGTSSVNASINANTAINSGTSTGTVTIGNSLAGAITVDTAAGISLDAATVSNFTVTGAGADLNLLAVGGSILVESTENAALAIRLHANGGTSETIQIHADQGTAATSLDLLSDVGGVSLRGGLNTGNAIIINATNAAGGINVDSGTGGVIVDTTGAISLDSALASNLTVTGAADLTLSSSAGSIVILGGEAVADAILLNSSNAAGGITMTPGTAGVNIAGNLNLTSVATKITMNGGAATDFIGTATLIGGQATILNTNIAASDRIMISRSALNASPALGFLVYTINAGASFVVNSLSAASAAVATDVSSFTYVIVRET